MDSPPEYQITRYSLLEKACASRDGKVWEDLLGYYEPFINKILLHMGLRGADLEDVRQQVLLKLWQGLESYKREENRARFRNWLSTLIRNAAIDWFRAQRRDHENTAEWASLDAEDPEIEGQIEREWQKHILSLAIGNLREVFSGKAMKVFSLSLKGEPVEDIAKTLGLRTESVYVLKTRVKTRLSREIARLRRELEGDSDE